MRNSTMTKKFYISLLIFSSLWAGQSDLQSKIAKLQTLPKTQRFKLVNEIKRQLAQMNESQRKEALGKLRASMHGGKGRGKKIGKGMHRGEGMKKQEHMPQNMQNHIRTQVHRDSPKRGTEHNPQQQRPNNGNFGHGR